MIDTSKHFLKAHWKQILSVVSIVLLVVSLLCVNSRAATTDEPFTGYGYYISEISNGQYGTTYTASSPYIPYLYATRASSGKRTPITEEYLTGYGTALITNVPILSIPDELDTYGNPRIVTSIRNRAYDSYVHYWWEYHADSSSTADLPTDLTFLRRTPLASLAVRALAPANLSDPPYNGYRAIPVDVTVYFYDVYSQYESSYTFEDDIDTAGTLYTDYLNYACQMHTTRDEHEDLLITGIDITPSTRYGAITSSITSNCLQIIAYTDVTPSNLPDTGVGMLSTDEAIQRAKEIMLSYELNSAYLNGRNSAITDNLGTTEWLTRAGDSVTSFTLFEVAGTPVTVGTILSIILGVFTMIMLLKLFAGG